MGRGKIIGTFRRGLAGVHDPRFSRQLMPKIDKLSEPENEQNRERERERGRVEKKIPACRKSAFTAERKYARRRTPAGEKRVCVPIRRVAIVGERSSSERPR